MFTISQIGAIHWHIADEWCNLLWIPEFGINCLDQFQRINERISLLEQPCEHELKPLAFHLIVRMWSFGLRQI